MDAVKRFSPALFAIIIFCFFLPFVNLSCGGQKIMSLTGFQLITGTEYKPTGMFDQENIFGEQEGVEQKSEEIKAQPLALFAFLAAILGLVFSLLRRKPTAFLCVVLSVLGVAFLILLKVNLDNDAELSGQGMQGVIQLDYQFGYWLAFLLFIFSAVLQWLVFKEPAGISKETPPEVKEVN